MSAVLRLAAATIVAAGVVVVGQPPASANPLPFLIDSCAYLIVNHDSNRYGAVVCVLR